MKRYIIILAIFLCSCSQKFVVQGYEVKHRNPMPDRQKALIILSFIGGYVIVQQVWTPKKIN